MKIRVMNESIIYVVSPAYFKTGGTELAHQLVFNLNNHNAKAYITYYDTGNCPFDINPEFSEYVGEFKKLDEVVDSPENILIVPEIRLDILKSYNKLQKCIWWMSVDNYLKNDGIVGSLEYFGILRTIKKIITREVRGKHNPIKKEHVHLYQSEYARRFLLKHGVEAIRLSDYINVKFETESKENQQRENVVLYNPKKGIKFTKKIMQAAPDLDWKPLINMTSQEVYECLSRSKVYIDFGEHPGKDRFPREAAICGCCVITGKKGAAKYYEDVPIDEKYKWNDSEKEIGNIIRTIKYCLQNYEKASHDFDHYRKFIASERKIFEDDVKQIFMLRE